jgi:hypothetical protein
MIKLTTIIAAVLVLVLLLLPEGRGAGGAATAVAAAAAAKVVVNTKAGGRRVGCWLCLERCNATQSEIQRNIQSVQSSGAFTDVSFERYNLGPNSTLVSAAGLSHIMPQLAAFDTWPMISSYPYPPAFIDWMRQVFAAPAPFIAQCIAEARAHGYTGYNIDWEPASGVVKADAAAYAKFLDRFATELHDAAGVLVSVDVSSWSVLWDYELISGTAVDQVVTMSTYTGTLATWQRVFQYALEHVQPRSKLVVGLQMINPSTNLNLTNADLTARFDAIDAAGVSQVNVWRLPLAPNWYPFLRNYLNNN